jgi:hypothetical protein
MSAHKLQRAPSASLFPLRFLRSKSAIAQITTATLEANRLEKRNLHVNTKMTLTCSG